MGASETLIHLVTRFAVDGSFDDDEFPYAITQSVTFTGPRTGIAIGPVRPAAGIRRWYAGLRRRGHQRLLLAIPSINTDGQPADRFRHGFINPVDWYLVADGSPRERWSIRQVHDAQLRLSGRPWRLEGMGSDEHSDAALASLDLRPSTTVGQALDEIVQALTAIRATASRFGRDEWVSSFDRALHIAQAPLDRPSPEAASQIGLIPPSWSTPDARRLLSAGYACGVFGGMGTWNDGRDDPVQSERLFRAMLTGFATALNT